MDNLDLKPEALESAAEIIEGYCSRQKSIMLKYLSETSALSSEWTDDETMGKLIAEIGQLTRSVEDVMDEILSIYPNYFRNKAQAIRSRPKL